MTNFLCGDLEDGWASNDGVVSGGSVAAGENNVGLAGSVLGDNDLVTSRNLLGLSEDGAEDGDESSVNLSALDLVALGGEGDGAASLDWHILGGSSQTGEGLDWESDVAGWAAGDEASGEGVDLVVAERSVEGGGER